VFDGIKMGATVMVNNVTVATVTDQFVRTVVPLEASGVRLLPGGANLVSVSFDPAGPLVEGRFAACSGFWDWAPLSTTTQPGVPSSAFTFTKGIWKSVYTVAVSSAAITYVVPHVYYTGDFPTSPLSDGNHAPFSVVGASQMRLPCLIVVLRRVVGSLLL
jgi:hypothetical protein